MIRVELAPIYSGLFNACLTHGEIAPMWELADATMSAARQTTGLASRRSRRTLDKRGDLLVRRVTI